MALQGLQGLGGPINYYDMIPDFRREALFETQNRVGQQAVIESQMKNAQTQKDNQRRDAFYEAIQNATPEQLPALRRQFPEFAENIQAEIGVQDAEHAKFVNKSLNNIAIARSSGNPQLMQDAIMKSAPALASMNMSTDQAMQLLQSDPQRFDGLLKGAQLATLPYEKQVDVQQNQQRIDETIRSNKAGEVLTARGQDISASTARRGQDLSMQRAGIVAGPGGRTVQLADGRTVTIGGKLHGAGANAFYEGRDNDGNMVRVPANAIAAPSTSASSAQNFAMAKDLSAIENASADDLNFMTGVTGGIGSPAVGADVRSRINGKEQRQLYSAAQRIQGKMQNQGIAAARDMGASGINTVAEAKMYFQGMPQLDFSSPEATQQSVREIRQYTDNYNQQYNVNIGGSTQPSQQPQKQSSGFSSLWGD
ncbi:phage DNA ejection protein [Atlantibacter subterraneus]|uniref:phage DNA ejection protein n=1 Tax=Atlantibacter subterraneus TaxID=255519 RepID=UPI0022EAE118|nr:phage DNA ejection protein [Atlantibacter subterranea]MDA3131684.1 phage DNA ejection protein [Atlantibacter subterranea]